MEKKNKKINIFILLIIIIFINSIYKKKRNNNSFQPKISVYLPIYNKEKFLKRSIRSIQKQTFRNIEIIPVILPEFSFIFDQI